MEDLLLRQMALIEESRRLESMVSGRGLDFGAAEALWN
jgi:hypothetical protein